MARRNYSAELIKAQENGQKIVCSVAPWDGHPVTYSPRRLRDPRPWWLTGSVSLRYTGRECHAVHPLTGQYFSYTVGEATVHAKITHIDPATGTAQVRADHWAKSVQIGTDRLFDAEMMNALTSAERFFYDHAGHGYNPATEIPFIGRVRYTRELAKSETERIASGMWIEWGRDDMPFDDDVHGPDEYGYVALLYRVNPETGRKEIVNSLGSIDAEPGDPYRRVVEAELFRNM